MKPPQARQLCYRQSMNLRARPATRGIVARLGIVLFAGAWLASGCADDGPRCSLSSDELPGSYAECVAANGTVVPATDLTPSFCVMSYSGYWPDRPDYGTCAEAGGYEFSWDVWCPPPQGTIGGTVCQLYYPENGCPTGTRPADYSWPMPACN